MNYNTNHNFNTLEVDYHPDLCKAYFSHISHLPWAMLLGSAGKEHPDSRFDILVAQPVASIETKGDTSTVSTKQGRFLSDEDPFSLIQQYSDKLLPNIENNSELPFIGGVLGYFGYDLGRRVEKIPTLAEHDIPIADMAVGIYEWALIVDHKKRKATLVGQNLKTHLQWLLSQLDNQGEKRSFALTSPWRSNMPYSVYEEKFRAIQEYLLSGDCYQVNLAQRYQASYQGDEWEAYLKLEQSNNAPFSAFIRTEASAILSVSPSAS